MVQVYDLGVTRNPAGRGFIAMRLVPGRRTLAAELRRCAGSGMPVQTTLWYLRRLLLPLAWLHRQDAPLVHGDLKPDNILLAPDGEPVLTDFGLAARLPLGVAGGTVPYEAPEVLAQGAGTPSSDVYSLGVIWYEMLAGRAPFSDVGLEALAAGDQAAYRRAHHESRKRLWNGVDGAAAADTQAGVPSPADFNPELREHPQLELLLARCLAWRSSQRFANAGMLLAEIDRLAAGGAVSAATLETQREARAAPAASAALPPSKLNDARALLARGDAQAALAMIEALLGSDPRNVPALVARAQALVALGRDDQARRSLGSAYAAAPADLALLEAYADLLEAGGQLSTAQALRRQASSLRARAASSHPTR
jgi:serine/threonine protein kinase